MKKFAKQINLYNQFLMSSHRGYRVTYDDTYERAKLILANTSGIEDYSFYLTKECEGEMILFFKFADINICFNNHRNIFWDSKKGEKLCTTT